jgi:hypothetical protein
VLAWAALADQLRRRESTAVRRYSSAAQRATCTACTSLHKLRKLGAAHLPLSLSFSTTMSVPRSDGMLS